MRELCGRRRNCGSDRWIAFQAVYEAHADGRVTFGMIFRDDTGFIPVIPEARQIAFDPTVMSADEAVRAAA